MTIAQPTDSGNVVRLHTLDGHDGKPEWRRSLDRTSREFRYGWLQALDGISDALGLDDFTDALAQLEHLYHRACPDESEDEIDPDESYRVALMDRHFREQLGLVLSVIRHRHDPNPRQPDVAVWLYHCYDADHRLVYVGIGRNPEGRWKAHRKRWGEDVIARCVKIRLYPDLKSATVAETALISELCPPLNHRQVDA